MKQLSAVYELEGERYTVNYWLSGDTKAKDILLCVHGLLGRSRDFDELVSSVAHRYLTIALDLPGRGGSQWLKSADLYTPQNYLPAIHAVLNAYPEKSVSWVGTSLGGILGMVYAHEEHNRLKKLVLNDVGSFIPGHSVSRIADYIIDPLFDSLDDVINFLRKTYPSFKHLNDQQWQRVARFGTRKTDKGYRLHYDPAIGVNTRANQGQDIDLEFLWHGIEVPQMLIHGTSSDLLSQSTVDKMRQHRPSLALLQLEGLGHAPPLMTQHEVSVLSSWLLNEETSVNNYLGIE